MSGKMLMRHCLFAAKGPEISDLWLPINPEELLWHVVLIKKGTLPHGEPGRMFCSKVSGFVLVLDAQRIVDNSRLVGMARGMRVAYPGDYLILIKDETQMFVLVMSETEFDIVFERSLLRAYPVPNDSYIYAGSGQPYAPSAEDIAEFIATIKARVAEMTEPVAERMSVVEEAKAAADAECAEDEETGNLCVLGISYAGPGPINTPEKQARVAALRQQHESEALRKTREMLDHQERIEALRQVVKAGSASERSLYPMPVTHTMVLLYGKTEHPFHFVWTQEMLFETCVTTCTLTYIWRNLDGEDRTVVQVGVSVCNPETDVVHEKKGYALAASRALFATDRAQGINVPPKGLSDKARHILAHRVRAALYLIFDHNQTSCWLF